MLRQDGLSSSTWGFVLTLKPYGAADVDGLLMCNAWNARFAGKWSPRHTSGDFPSSAGPSQVLGLVRMTLIQKELQFQLYFCRTR